MKASLLLLSCAVAIGLPCATLAGEAAPLDPDMFLFIDLFTSEEGEWIDPMADPAGMDMLGILQTGTPPEHLANDDHERRNDHAE